MFDGLMDGLDPRKAAQLVDDLWDERHRIVEAVSFVMDQRDELVKVMRFVADHGDDLLDLAKRLPDFLGEVGDGMQAAGSTASRAANFLAGDGDDGGGVLDLANLAAEAFESVQDELEVAVKLLARIGAELEDLAIPSVEPEYTEVAGFRVISGLDIGRSHPVAGAAKQIASGGDRLDAIAGQVRQAAGQVRELGVRIGDMGNELGDAGQELSSSGVMLASFHGAQSKSKPTAKRKPTARKKPARKKTASKKRTATTTATKKAATKKAPRKKTVPKKKTATTIKNPAFKSGKAKPPTSKRPSTR